MKKLLTFFVLLANVALARDLTLDQAIDLSLNNSKEMKISEKSLEISKLNVSKAFKEALPSVTYSGAVTLGEHERNILTQSGGNYVSKKKGYTQTLKVTQPLFTGGAISAGIKGAKAYENIASYSYLQSKIQNRLDTIKIYSDIINAERNLAALKSSEEILLKRHYKQEEQLKLRLITKPDILQTEYSLEDIRAQIINLQNLADTNKEKLYIRTGINKSEPLNLVSFDIPNNLSDSLNLNTDLNQALNQSLSAKIADEQVNVASASRMAAAGDLLPQVSAYVSYGTGGQERASFSRSYRDAEWVGGVQVSWKVFSFGKDLDNYKVAKLEKEFNISYSRGESKRTIKKIAKDYDLTSLTTDDIFDVYKKYFDSVDMSEFMELNLIKQYDIKEIMDNILIKIYFKNWLIDDLFLEAENKLHLIYIFLAILELYKDAKINIDDGEIRKC